MFFELTLFIGFEFELFWNLKIEPEPLKPFIPSRLVSLATKLSLKKSSFVDIHYHPQPGNNHRDN